MEKLKPCCKCGGEKIEFGKTGSQINTQWYLSCKCGMCLMKIVETSDAEHARAVLTQHWNDQPYKTLIDARTRAFEQSEHFLKGCDTNKLEVVREKALKFCMYQIMRYQPALLVPDDGVIDTTQLYATFQDRLSIIPHGVGGGQLKILNGVLDWAQAINAIAKIEVGESK